MNPPYLVLIRGEEPHSPDLSRRYEIPKEGIYLGNTKEAQVPILLQESEPCYIHIFFEGPTCYVHVLLSPINVLVAGVPVHSSQIFDGELLQIGRIAFEFCARNSVKEEFYENGEEVRRDDLLTGAFNGKTFRRFMELDLFRYNQWELDRRSSPYKDPYPPMSLIMADIDNFGLFNKTYNQLVGNSVLKEVVCRFKERVRASDIVGRLGGEEFAVYLPNTHLEKAIEVAEDIRKRLAETPFQISSELQVQVTVSFGVAQFQAGMDADEFLVQANEYMKKAKEEGKNRVRAENYSP